jgi:Rrf2 family protein
MDIIRRDTDYALRMAAYLARAYETAKPVSARTLAQENHVSYAIACKLLQKLSAAALVTSIMGPRGGFVLTREPKAITFKQVLEAIQGPITVNRCLLGDFKCPLKGTCPVHPKVGHMQRTLNDFLAGVTLAEFAKTKGMQNDDTTQKAKRYS